MDEQRDTSDPQESITEHGNIEEKKESYDKENAENELLNEAYRKGGEQSIDPKKTKKRKLT